MVSCLVRDAMIQKGTQPLPTDHTFRPGSHVLQQSPTAVQSDVIDFAVVELPVNHDIHCLRSYL